MAAAATSVYCATGGMCSIPKASAGFELTTTQALVSDRWEATKAENDVTIYNGVKVIHDPKRTGSGVLYVDKKIMVNGRDLLAELDQRGAGLSSSGGGDQNKNKASELKMKGPTLSNPLGRMNVNAKGPLYLLAQDGVVVSKEWSGTGSLKVEGDLCVGDVCFDKEEWRKIKTLLAATPATPAAPTALPVAAAQKR